MTVDVGKMNLEIIKHFMDRSHPGKDYKVFEYGKFYTAVIDTSEEDAIMEPILFSKQGAMPLFESLGSKSPEELKNPKLIYGGSDNA